MLNDIISLKSRSKSSDEHHAANKIAALVQSELKKYNWPSEVQA